MQQLENDLDQTQEKLMNANQRLEEKEKALQNAEGEVAALNRRIQMLEEDLEKSEDRLQIASQKLGEASTAADDNSRMCKVSKNQKTGYKLHHKNWARHPPQLMTIHVCAKSWKTKAYRMKPEWKPWKTILKMQQFWQKKLTKNTMK